ncbi:MAG TPA: hypothetical protein VNJ31_01320 [Methyloceanibacter sp.]|nr:hypothetical protein [Methyloceanibacter sp.]
MPVILTLITQYMAYRSQREEALQKIQSAATDAEAKIAELKSQAEQRSRELDIRMVEIALSLLKPDPNVEPSKIGAREWAVDVMEKYSGVRFSPAARRSIIETSVPVDKGILQGAAGTPAVAPPLPPLLERIGGNDYVAILDDPEHSAKWTTANGAAIDFARPISDTVIKAAGGNFTLIGGQIFGAYAGAASMGYDFYKWLKGVGRPAAPGTCFRLIAPYKDRFGGLLFGKIEDAACR